MPEVTGSPLENGNAESANKDSRADRGRRRYLSFSMDFDSRGHLLNQDINENWEEEVKENWRKSRSSILENLEQEFGPLGIQEKIENFTAMGAKPFSILTYHNQFFEQVRRAYVIGAYYPALVGACALGERILNHLILDLRDFYKSTPEYKRVYRKKSFDDWAVPIAALSAWQVLLPGVAEEFISLMSIRHRSIHFNVGTYQTLKQDSLDAILHLNRIIQMQFGAIGSQPWFLKGTLGHQFIARDWEECPFIQKYFLPKCPLVGPLFSMKYSEEGWLIFDFLDYGAGDLTDEDFCREFNARTPEMLARQ